MEIVHEWRSRATRLYLLLRHPYALAAVHGISAMFVIAVVIAVRR